MHSRDNVLTGNIYICVTHRSGLINNCFICCLWHLWLVYRMREQINFLFSSGSNRTPIQCWHFKWRLHSHIDENFSSDLPHKFSFTCIVRAGNRMNRTRTPHSDTSRLNCCVQNNRYGNLPRSQCTHSPRSLHESEIFHQYFYSLALQVTSWKKESIK